MTIDTKERVMMSFRLVTVAIAACCLVACATGSFDTSWKAPEATALQIQGAKVAAIAMMENEAARRAAEDALVRELNQRGAQGVAMYSIMSGASPGNETEVHAALDGMGFAGAVVMRPVGKRTEIVSDPIYIGARYSHLWGGYYGYGWSEPWPVAVVGNVRTRTLVSIEVLVYSLRQNRLVWGGQTTTTDSTSVTSLVETTARRVARNSSARDCCPPLRRRWPGARTGAVSFSITMWFCARRSALEFRTPPCRRRPLRRC